MPSGWVIRAGSPQAAAGPRDESPGSAAPAGKHELGPGQGRSWPGLGVAGAGAGAVCELGLGREDSASWRQRAPGAAVRRTGAARAGAERRGEARSASGGYCHVFPAVAAAREEGSGGSSARRQVGREQRGGGASGRARRPGTRRECGHWDSAVPATPAPPPRRADCRGPSRSQAQLVPAGRAGAEGALARPPARPSRLRTRNPRRCGARAAAGKSWGGRKVRVRADSGVGGTRCEGVPGRRRGDREGLMWEGGRRGSSAGGQEGVHSRSRAGVDKCPAGGSEGEEGGREAPRGTDLGFGGPEASRLQCRAQGVGFASSPPLSA